VQETPLTVVGNAVDDPTIRFTPSGVAVANFRIAHTDRKFNRQTNSFEDGDSLYLGVVCWKTHAENVAETVRRGMRLVVTGHLRMQTYEKKDGTKGSSYEIAEAEVAVSLRSATAVVTKSGGSGGQPAAQQQSGGGG
jgi:single-strand DNA-binding protein